MCNQSYTERTLSRNCTVSQIYGVLYKQSSSIAFDETSSYWSALKKTPNFSAFHWSPRGSLVSIGQHFVATRVVHLPKSTETILITESDQSGLNHQLLQLCTARTAWSDSDQAVRAVHSCNSWFIHQSVSISPRNIYNSLKSIKKKDFSLTDITFLRVFRIFKTTACQNLKWILGWSDARSMSYFV